MGFMRNGRIWWPITLAVLAAVAAVPALHQQARVEWLRLREANGGPDLEAAARLVDRRYPDDPGMLLARGANDGRRLRQAIAMGAGPAAWEAYVAALPHIPRMRVGGEGTDAEDKRGIGDMMRLSTLAAVAAPISGLRLQSAQASTGSPASTSDVAPSSVQSDTPPPVVDYSRYVTFVRKQTGGGCGTMTSLAILDIFAERDYPYSPDFSYRFAAHVYNNPLGKLNQLDVLQQYGCCSEASLPTNDDPGKYLVPAPAHYVEAAMYKIAAYSDVISKPSVDDLKRFLWKYGPVFAVGDTPGSPPHGHVFATIGYDDRTRMFKVLNSFGDRWGNKGMMDMPYDNLANPPPDNERSTPRVDWVRWVQAMPKPPRPPHPYTCRISLHHSIGRNHLTVRIWAAGQEPRAVWDRPNRIVNPDDSRDLVLDVPLPPARSPSSARQVWYVEISDDGPPGPESVAMLNDLVFAHRSATEPPLISRPSSLPVPIPSGGTIRLRCPMRSAPS
jgi:hypothetical protein